MKKSFAVSGWTATFVLLYKIYRNMGYEIRNKTMMHMCGRCWDNSTD